MVKKRISAGLLIGLAVFTAPVLARAQDLQLLRGADTDGDHAISVAEATAVFKQEFARLDANGDGKITRDEVRAFFRNLRPQSE